MKTPIIRHQVYSVDKVFLEETKSSSRHFCAVAAVFSLWEEKLGDSWLENIMSGWKGTSYSSSTFSSLCLTDAFSIWFLESVMTNAFIGSVTVGTDLISGTVVGTSLAFIDIVTIRTTKWTFQFLSNQKAPWCSLDLFNIPVSGGTILNTVISSFSIDTFLSVLTNIFVLAFIDIITRVTFFLISISTGTDITAKRVHAVLKNHIKKILGEKRRRKWTNDSRSWTNRIKTRLYMTTIFFQTRKYFPLI